MRPKKRMVMLRDGLTPEQVAKLDATLEPTPDGAGWYTPEEQMIRFDEKSRTLWLPRPNKALEEQLDANYERLQGLRWRVVEDGFTIDRALSFARAKISGTLSRDDAVVKQRLASCNGCDALKRDQRGSWCIPCGCGNSNLMINVDGTPAVKMLYRVLNCPKFRPGYSNEVKHEAPTV